MLVRICLSTHGVPKQVSLLFSLYEDAFTVESEQGYGAEGVQPSEDRFHSRLRFEVR